MKPPTRRQTRTIEGCRDCRRPSAEARDRYADAQARAMLRRMPASDGPLLMARF